MAAPPPPSSLPLRLKYGIHSIFMFADPNDPFTTITKELFELLRDRYPDGLTAMMDDPKKFSVPSKDEEAGYVIDYGVPTNSLDLTEGWTDLDVSNDGTATIGSKNLRRGSILAFMIRGADKAKHGFIVESAQTALGDDDDGGDDTVMAMNDGAFR